MTIPGSAEVDPRVRQELEALVGRRIIGPARAIGYDLPARGFSEPLTGEMWWQRPDGDWLLATPRALDPAVAQSGGRMPVPPDVCDRIARLHAHGVDCEHVAVVHELPPGIGPGDPLPSLVPSESPRLSDEAVVALSRVPLVLGQAALRGSVAAGAVGVAALGSLAAGLAQLDPILFGGVEHPELPVVAWCELARWEW